MKQLRNLLHGGVLAVWAVLGLIFTFKALFMFGSLGTLAMVAGFWLWFAGLSGGTTWLVTRFNSAASSLIVHAAVFFGLQALPRVMPLSWLRYGIDVLQFG